MFENLFRNVASMAYLVGLALVITTSNMVGVLAADPTSPPVIAWWDLARILLCAFCGYMAARSAGACFGANVDLHWTKAALADIAAKSKAGPAQDDGNTPPTT